ncbi:MAG: AAA family ATPase [Salinibacter sp.]
MNILEFGERARAEIAKAVQGQEATVEGLLVAVLSGGHVLLEGAPGIAKTLLARTVAHCLGCDFKRIQFTPDMMPSDVVGTNVFDMRQAEFHLHKGPIFAELLLADEVNRTPPKTQAALLQAMEEHTATIDGVDYDLGSVFTVFATQNPIEHEGTYPLPEAQTDRFMLKIDMPYPSEAEERAILRRHHRGFDPHDVVAAGVEPLTDASELIKLRQQLRDIQVDEALLGYMIEIVRRSRGAFQVAFGASPRAQIALLHGGKALAALRGRDYVIPDDVKDLAPAVLRHRLLLQPEAEIEGVTSNQVIANLLDEIDVPR